MAVSRDDQNTFLMIGGVLIICLIALIAVVSSIWSIIREPVNSVINTVSTFIKIQTLDYNFPLPTQYTATNPTPTPSPNPSPAPAPIALPSISFSSNNEKDIDYNFPVDNSINGQLDSALFTDSQLTDRQTNGETVEQKNLNIQIPSLNIDSPVLQGLDSEDLLKQGFWVLPSDRKLGQAEIVLLCNRRYFGPSDPKSCWFLDKIQKGSSISIQYNQTSLIYNVVGINVFAANNPLVYKASNDEDLIRIVTTDPLASNENRLVVLAKRVK